MSLVCWPTGTESRWHSGDGGEVELWHDEKVEVDEEVHKRRVYRLKEDPSQLFLRARELAKVSHQINNLYFLRPAPGYLCISACLPDHGAQLKLYLYEPEILSACMSTGVHKQGLQPNFGHLLDVAVHWGQAGRMLASNSEASRDNLMKAWRCARIKADAAEAAGIEVPQMPKYPLRYICRGEPDMMTNFLLTATEVAAIYHWLANAEQRCDTFIKPLIYSRTALLLFGGRHLETWIVMSLRPLTPWTILNVQ
jgi:hypothetical protein